MINSLILLLALGLPLSLLFWKHFAKRPGETARAIIATGAAMLGLIVFFVQVYIMTVRPSENLITMLQIWLGS